MNSPTKMILIHENDFFAHESHEFSCKRVQTRTCSGYAECRRKCQRNLHETISMDKKATFTVARIFTNSMIALEIFASVW